jgi:hypothetical protein
VPVVGRGQLDEPVILEPGFARDVELVGHEDFVQLLLDDGPEEGDRGGNAREIDLAVGEQCWPGQVPGEIFSYAGLFGDDFRETPDCETDGAISLSVQVRSCRAWQVGAVLAADRSWAQVITYRSPMESSTIMPIFVDGASFVLMRRKASDKTAASRITLHPAWASIHLMTKTGLVEAAP